MRIGGKALACCLLASAVPLGGCATLPDPNVSTAQPTAASDAQIKAVSNRVANWQLANMGNLDSWIRSISPQTDKPRGWVMGTFFLGLADYAQTTNQPRFTRALQEIAIREEWRLGDRLYHADDHLVGQVYARIAPQGPARKAALAPTLASFDAILANPPRGTLDHPDTDDGPQCSQRWCWADALFMAPASWWAMSRETGNPAYADYAHSEFQAIAAKLLDPQTAFFFRDSRFLAQRGDDGEKLFWSRGNGWVYGGLVNILRTMPQDDPRRGYYLDLFQRMSKSLVAVQTKEGMWRASLLATSKTPPETSGTGFFTYGLAWGVNQGILTEPSYRLAALNGWAALARNVDASGRLGYVQQIGDRPTEVRPTDHQFYGHGAMLLAAGQMLELN